MRYLVISDNHGDRDILQTIKETFLPKVDLLIHCGDSELPSDDELWVDYYTVRGNCDYDEAFKMEQVMVTKQDRLFVTHGHRYFVNTSLSSLGSRAEEEKATIVLFGHTHKQGCEMLGQRLFLNPGSISQPRSIPLKTFAIIDSTETAFNVQYYDRQCLPIEKLAFSFKKN